MATEEECIYSVKPCQCLSCVSTPMDLLICLWNMRHSKVTKEGAERLRKALDSLIDARS